jgi:eukaryotic-like serine/threonine-protein kinase
MKIDPDRWPVLSELMDQYLDLPEDRRTTWVENLGPEYASFLPEFREMLANRADDLLQTLPELDEDANQIALPFAVGTLVGPYRLLRELGHGGMGVVWLAERTDGSLKRDIALKLPLFSVHNQTLADRFARERDILARLAEARIARLYDAGLTAHGQPYLALEYIEGEPITAYCDRLCLDITARLKLFREILQAVQYAHVNLVVHRDLKPSNILVTRTGQVRLLDFGIAKLLTQGEAEETDITRFGGRALTPDYCSPEQATGAAITTAADVYSLGILLYELLTGSRPYKLRRDMSAEIGQAILCANVVRPSQAVIDEAKARARTATEKRLRAALRGDLDTIVLKAIQKEAQARYSTADAFAQDVERYLGGQPVLARPESAWYRARKFVRRNKFAVASGVAIGLALSVGATFALWQAHRASQARLEAFRERDRAVAAEQRAGMDRDRALLAEQSATKESALAQRERNLAVAEKRRADTQTAAATAVSDFLENDLLAQAGAWAQASPNQPPDPDLKVRTALDRAAAKISGKFDSQPAVEAAIRQTIGKTYRDLGLYAEAERQMERTLELRRRVLGPEHPDTLFTMNVLALAYINDGKYAPAEALLTDLIDVRRRFKADEDPETLAAMSQLAMVVSQGHGDYARSEKLLGRVLEVQRRTLGESHADTLAVMNNLAVDYVNQGKYAQAEELYQKVVETKQRVLGPEHPSTLTSMNGLGVLYRNEGKYQKAEALFRTVLEERRRTMGEQHPDTLLTLNSLGLLYQAEGRNTEAEPLLIQVLEARRRLLGDDNPDTMRSLNNVAELYRRQNKLEQAASMFQQLLDARRRVLGPDHPNTINVLVSLGEIKLQQHAYAEAEPLFRDALQRQQKTSPDAWRRYYTESMLGTTLTVQGKYEEAEPLSISSYQNMIQRRASIPVENRGILDEAKKSLVSLYEAWGKPEKAAEWRSR